MQCPIMIPPLIKQAQMAFFRDLPKLLIERPGKWIAYQGERRVGFASNDLELYRECHRRGIPEDEFLVLCIEPEAGEVVIGPSEIS